MNTQSSHEWFQEYPAENMVTHSLPELSFDETFDLVTNDIMINPSLSGDATSTSPKLLGHSNPKRGIIGKPVRRRSRASRKAPTTLLNANTNNFRALVQQFTGCHSAPPAFGPYKGPINLNFAQYKHSGDDHENRIRSQQNVEKRREKTDESTTFSSTTFGINNGTVVKDDDEDLFVSNIVDNHNPRDDAALTLDDFDMENFSLQEELSGAGDRLFTWD